MPVGKTSREVGYSSRDSTPVHPSSAGKSLPLPGQPPLKKKKSSGSSSSAANATLDSSGVQSAFGTPQLPSFSSPTVSVTATGADPAWLAPLSTHLKSVAKEPNRIAEVPADPILLDRYAERQFLMAAVTWNEVKWSNARMAAEQRATIKKLQESNEQFEKELALLKAENKRLSVAPMKLQDELDRLSAAKKGVEAKAAADIKELNAAEKKLQAEVDELHKQLEEGASMEKMLEEEIEDLKSGKGLDQAKVWDSDYWSDYRDDVAYGYGKEVYDEITKKCEGGLSGYPKYLEDERNRVLEARKARGD